MSWRFDPKTGGMVRTKPAPLPADLARAMVEGLNRNKRAISGGPPPTWDRMLPAEQRGWIEAARFAINRLGL